jgi:hypothetical protein
MTDRFTKATSELSERNAYVCESCGSESVTLSSRQAVDVERHEERTHEEGLHVTGLDIGSTRFEKIINSDPTPFGA